MKTLSKTNQAWAQVQAVSQSQGLVISARQCALAGFGIKRVSRFLERGEWQRLLPGIYFTSSGSLSWAGRLHAALLYTGEGSVVSHEAAGFSHGFVDRPPRKITVSIPAKRRVQKQDGLVIYRRRDVPASTGSPAVTTPAETLVDLLDEEIEMVTALGYVTRGIRKGVRPQDVLHALSRRKRHRNRMLLRSLLHDSHLGIESPLEYYFVRDVESAHGLPRSQKQAPAYVGGRWIRTDCIYNAFRLRIELDGEIAHPGGRTDRDTWRDNAVSIEQSDLTLRYRWSHVLVTPCQTARQIAHALRQRGWSGKPKKCGPHCRV